MRPGQDTKRVATSLVLDTFGDFLSSEEDVWLARREVFETEVGAALRYVAKGFVVFEPQKYSSLTELLNQCS